MLFLLFFFYYLLSFVCAKILRKIITTYLRHGSSDECIKCLAMKNYLLFFLFFYLLWVIMRFFHYDFLCWEPLTDFLIYLLSFLSSFLNLPSYPYDKKNNHWLWILLNNLKIKENKSKIMCFWIWGVIF